MTPENLKLVEPVPQTYAQKPSTCELGNVPTTFKIKPVLVYTNLF